MRCLGKFGVEYRQGGGTLYLMKLKQPSGVYVLPGGFCMRQDDHHKNKTKPEPLRKPDGD
jgi:hypothetical protein